MKVLSILIAALALVSCGTPEAESNLSASKTGLVGKYENWSKTKHTDHIFYAYVNNGISSGAGLKKGDDATKKRDRTLKLDNNNTVELGKNQMITIVASHRRDRHFNRYELWFEDSSTLVGDSIFINSGKPAIGSGDYIMLGKSDKHSIGGSFSPSPHIYIENAGKYKIKFRVAYP